MNLTVQWHITEECNWQCKHCYHDEHKHKGPGLSKLKEIYDEIVSIKSNSIGDFSETQISIVGGEPFMKKELFPLLEYINANTNGITIPILTNGSLLNEEKIKKLKKLKNINFRIQLSIEGTEEYNDKIRGLGTYKQIINTIELCKKNKLYVSLSLTLSKDNTPEIFKLIPLITEHDILMKVRKLVPMGKSQGEDSKLLTASEFFNLTKKIYKVNNVLKENKQLLNAGVGIKGCSEGSSYKYSGGYCPVNKHILLTIMHNLDILTCVKLPIILGNLKNSSLKEIYLGDKYKEIRDSSQNIDICKKCSYFKFCKGGARCITYAIKGNLNHVDPQCYYAKILNKKFNIG